MPVRMLDLKVKMIGKKRKGYIRANSSISSHGILLCSFELRLAVYDLRQYAVTFFLRSYPLLEVQAVHIYAGHTKGLFILIPYRRHLLTRRWHVHRV